ncbi:23S rRNA (adenine(2030)-N(6))-methyltransferase RlmJ [Thiomicrorhabdus sp. 6S3-12]|uniref:23S rRNA (adenine(2030)-N(6))-methyltransferase RlmJ n=1 Tax=Thiomicrorhabdus sp. 6S3-12 TaxID=2819681 RepID=UPI001AAD4265|nr:23S rRNA (adenine(2030)-N(6))-methyltransferase RlmJ [Thiomicrorhabdus sp. 6S3-12]MBO1924086.1 23S rRNA (adenine(2030)-N(6))-methyltransferase RlmJ [Thiomicrorhabdus sp. 6S3-12]
MLSYLHSFHAGNFADVLKHLVSTQILQYLTQKPKPLYYLDTHSSSGAFQLEHREAQKNQEYLNGIAKLWSMSTPPAALESYLKLVKEFNGGAELKRYPGSPWFAQALLRETDRAHLFELHPREYKLCKNNFADDRRFKVFNSDGFHACLSQLPPKEKRGFILMDPPYEVKQDYDTAVDALTKAHKKFATGTYALWYPVVERKRIDRIEKRFRDSGIRNIQLFELGIADDREIGMTASGMIVINPPWILKSELDTVLPLLAKTLGGNKGFYRSEQLVEE